MTDLTKIEKPYGLLDEATQKALRECGGPWQMVGLGGWEDCCDVLFSRHITYRQKPQPPKPREWFCILEGKELLGGFASATLADVYAKGMSGTKIIHVREVIE